MSFHRKKIAELSGVLDFSDLVRIEECMRDTVFHSTLDWQTQEQFSEGVLKALSILRTGAKMGYWELLNSDLEDSSDDNSL